MLLFIVITSPRISSGASVLAVFRGLTSKIKLTLAFYWCKFTGTFNNPLIERFKQRITHWSHPDKILK
jgi:hypothetical protein